MFDAHLIVRVVATHTPPGVDQSERERVRERERERERESERESERERERERVTVAQLRCALRGT